MSRIIERRESGDELRLDRPPTPQAVHPWAWWVWALCLAACATKANNPLFLLLLVAAIVFVVLNRRVEAAWTRSLGFYFTLAGFIIVMRLFFQVSVGGLRDGTILFTTPEIPLPDWAAGIRLGGPVALEAIVYSVIESGRIGAMILAIGAANTLANPKRALKSVPTAFAQLATAIVIALSLAPQLIESIHRIHRARKLRGTPAKGIRGLIAIFVPVLVDATERAMALASSMESRGYGRTRNSKPIDVWTSLMLIVAMVLTIFGTYALLGVDGGLLIGLTILAAGIGLLCLAIYRCSKQITLTRYRPDPWRGVETMVCAAGVVCAIGTFWLASNSPFMGMITYPMHWPQLSPLMVVVAIVAASPGAFTPKNTKAWQ